MLPEHGGESTLAGVAMIQRDVGHFIAARERLMLPQFMLLPAGTSPLDARTLPLIGQFLAIRGKQMNECVRKKRDKLGQTAYNRCQSRLFILSIFCEKDMNMTASASDTHSNILGYLLWLFGFTGAHRFYYGKPVTGTLWFFTLGLFGIGWIVDLFLIPGMDREVSHRFSGGHINYSKAWLLLTFLGYLGLHRMYMGKWGTGILYLFTCGLFLFGVLFDFWTLNTQISERNLLAGTGH